MKRGAEFGYCARCRREDLPPEKFRVYRDGVWLATADCADCLRQDDVDHNRYQREKKRAAR